ncbi:MAG: hypothetical protein Q8Q09_19765 [Deltaproteobacteria bacterium]|nr:hypothetical protein [Deltaproteobacteria bacterium]
MNRAWRACALGVFACVAQGCASRDRAPIADPSSVSVRAIQPARARVGQLDDPEILAALAEHPSFAQRTLLPLCGARFGTRIALVVWPMFDPQGASAEGLRLATDDAVGVTLDRGPDGSLVVLRAGWNPRDHSGRTLIAQLGSERYTRMGVSEGAPLQALSSRVFAHYAGFSNAMTEQNRTQAYAHAQAMRALFAWDVLAYEDVLPEMLWAASTGEYVLEERSVEVLSPTQGRIVGSIRYRGRQHPIEVLAEQTDSHEGAARFVIRSEHTH